MKEVTTDQLCKGKKVVLFAVPGAFTPTCSMKHLPGFIQAADEIKVRGRARVGSRGWGAGMGQLHLIGWILDINCCSSQVVKLKPLLLSQEALSLLAVAQCDSST